jgi:hypothetical protein
MSSTACANVLCFAKTSSAICLISVAIAVSRGGRRTVSGETMTSACPEGSVMVSPMGPVPVKGLEAPIESYELRGAMPPPLEAPRGRIDSESQALLDELVESLPGARVLLRHVAQLLNQHVESRGEAGEAACVGAASQRGLESITGAPIRQHGTRFVLWDQAQQTTPHRMVRERGSSGKENRNP